MFELNLASAEGAKHNSPGRKPGVIKSKSAASPEGAQYLIEPEKRYYTKVAPIQGLKPCFSNFKSGGAVSVEVQTPAIDIGWWKNALGL